MAEKCYIWYTVAMPSRTILTAMIMACALLAGTLPSAHATGGASCTVSALDSVAGLGGHISLQGCAALTRMMLTIRGPNGETNTVTISTDASGAGSTTLAPSMTERSGTYLIDADGISTSFTVLPDRADANRSIIDASPSIIQHAAERTTVSVILRDRYGNPLAKRPLALMSSRVGDEMQPPTGETDETGTARWTVRAASAVAAVFMPYDLITGRPIGISMNQQARGGSIFSASITGNELGGDPAITEPAMVQAFCLLPPSDRGTDVPLKELFSLTIVAVHDPATCDALRSKPSERDTLLRTAVVRSYVGTVIIESSDPSSELPKTGIESSAPRQGQVEFRNFDQGVRFVPLSFSITSPGPQTFRVMDKDDPNITGSITLNDTTGLLRIISPTNGERVPRSENILIQGYGPSLLPIIIHGGASPVAATIGADGIFRIDVPLPKERSEVTIFVSPESSQQSPAQVFFVIDDQAPNITTASIDPERGRTDADATVRVVSEAGLASVTATIGTSSVSLAASEQDATTYIGTLRAPMKEGTYDVTITAKDAANNVSNLLLKWTVIPRSLPQVTGLTAERKDGHIALAWNAVTGMDITEYRIYIAKAAEPENVLYSIGTGKPILRATVKDLPRGHSYRFWVTARAPDGTESPEKSAPATASVPGLSPTATPSAGGLMLQWDPIADLPLSRYRLDIGTEPGIYPESRTIEGSARSTVIKDLMEGITYELRLTPILVTGVQADDLAAVLRVTAGPASIADAVPVPSDLMGESLHSGADLAPVLPTPDPPTIAASGLTSVILMLLIGLAGIAAVWFWHLRRERIALRAFLAGFHHSNPS